MTEDFLRFLFDIDYITRIVYRQGIMLAVGRRAKEGVMDVLAQRNPSVD